MYICTDIRTILHKCNYICTVCTCICRHVVLDEADHMLERGFKEQLDDILMNCYTDSEFIVMSSLIATLLSY